MVLAREGKPQSQANIERHYADRDDFRKLAPSVKVTLARARVRGGLC